MTQIFRLPIDLEALADELAPLLADRLVRDAQAAADEMPPEPADDDPWGEPEPKRERRSASRSGSSRGGSGRGRQAASGVPSSGSHEDGNGKRWEFGLSDAPSCKHGPAAEVTKPGANWRAWACPLGYSKDTYRNKCDFWEYQD